MNQWVEAVPVRLGETRVVRDAGALSVLGLGSCVAVIIHDQENRVGGVVHVLLPSHTLARDQSKPGKFADTGVPHLWEELARVGAKRVSAVARLAGGASMFAALGTPGTLHMGERNVVACRAALRRVGIPVVGESVGGETSRSVVYEVADGSVTVRSVGGTPYDL